MVESRAEYPEKPTLIERFVDLIPIRYALGCLLLSSVFGVPGLLIARYIDTFNLDVALSLFGPLLWQNVVTFSLANFGLALYALYGIRYMRSRIVEAKPLIVPLMPEREKTLLRLNSQLKQVVDMVENPMQYAQKSNADDLRSLFAFEIMERRISAISEWPFDFRTLSWLSAIVLTVIGAVVTRYVLILIGL